MNRDMSRVLDCIRLSGRVNGQEIKVTYKEISEITGIQITMVSSIISYLCRNGFIEKINHKNESGGNCANTYKIRRQPI